MQHPLLVEAAGVLGVAGPDAPAAEIEKAFKKLAVQWHPDRNPDRMAEATARFAEISAARDLLLDPPPLPLPSAQAQPAPAEADASLRKFEGDVTAAVADGTLAGVIAEELFASHKLWVVWHCRSCGLVCCRVRKEKYSCLCGHRLSGHDAGRGFRCASAGCACRRFEWAVQVGYETLKCRCKHVAALHTPPAQAGGAWRCTKPGCGCAAFSSPYKCNCGHDWAEHSCKFVEQYITPRCREWVAGGLRRETVALANRFRARSAAERAAFVRRANAAREAGAPSFKALVRQQAYERGEVAPSGTGRPTGAAARGAGSTTGGEAAGVSAATSEMARGGPLVSSSCVEGVQCAPCSGDAGAARDAGQRGNDMQGTCSEHGEDPPQ